MSTIMSMFKRGNDALSVNPTVADIDLSVHGSDWLWAVFCIMALSAITLAVLGARQPVGQRVFHNLAAAICFTASIAYFCMASDLGAAAIPVEFIRGGSLGENWVRLGVADPTRAIYYVRYIDWVITTPLLLLEILLATGMPLSDIFFTLFADEAMIVTGLVGALVQSRYKWGLFTFGCVAEFYIWWILLGPARKSANAMGPEFHKAYATSAIILSGLWLLYPVAWGLAEGGNVITVTSEMVFYGILDLLAKPVFCFVHIFAVSKLNLAQLELQSGKRSDGVTNGLLHHNGAATTNDPRSSISTAVGHQNAYNKPAGATTDAGALHSDA